MGTARDPFDAGGLRQRVLDAWAASPARFREDANAEEELALGGYRDRLVVELAQNAADAAARKGVAGRLRLVLRDGALVAANTGAPLDAAGVEALSTLRASAKRDERAAVGRFGVGFAAVLAVTDEPRVCSSTGAVRWSRSDTLDRVRDIRVLADELARRGGTVPVLRLPFPADDQPPEGFDTAVVLPLRDERAEGLTRRLLDETGPALLIALPALEAVEIEAGGVVRELRSSRSGDVVDVDVGGAPTRWRLAQAGGDLDPALLADRPTEERTRPHWSVTWAVPVDGEDRPYRALPPGVPGVVHAPTPSDERLELPALLLAPFPLAPDRRHVAPGPLTDFLVRAAGETYAEVVSALPPDPSVLALVPGPAAAGELDAMVRRAILAVLPETPFLPTAAGPGGRVSPRAAVVVDAGPDAGPALLDLLAPVIDGLVPAGWPPRAQAFTALGVRRMHLADVVDLLAGLDREPRWWVRVYTALESADAEALGALPVPLADGRLVRGVRGLLVAAEGVDPARLTPLPLRFVHPDAFHPVLRRLGALPATPRVVLDESATRAAVAHSCDDEDPQPIAEAVLGLVAAAGLEPGEEPWLADLALPADDGEWSPAGELLLPESPLAGVIAEDAPLGVLSPDTVERVGPQVCEAAGVLRTFAVLREDDVPLDPEVMDHDLDGEAEWAEDVLAELSGEPDRHEGAAPPLLPELVAVRDLDLVDPDLWEDALALLAGRDLRAAVVEPARVLLPGGRELRVRSYTAWWLARHPVIDGRRPTELRVSSDPLLAGLYDAAPGDTAPELLAAIGGRTTVAALLAEAGGPDELLARLADPSVPVARSQLRALLSALAMIDVDRVTPPERVRAVVGREVDVVSAEEAVVVDAPDLVPLLGGRPLLLVRSDVAEPLADVLDVALASEMVAGAVESSGEERPVPDVVREILPDTPETYVAHDRLIADGHEVTWRCVGRTVHACGTAGLARGLAWAAGRFEARLLVEVLLTDPGRAGELLVEADLGG